MDIYVVISDPIQDVAAFTSYYKAKKYRDKMYEEELERNMKDMHEYLLLRGQLSDLNLSPCYIDFKDFKIKKVTLK